MKGDKGKLITEELIEHGLLFCKKMREDGKTLDDLIEHLSNQLKILKIKNFEKIEEEVYE